MLPWTTRYRRVVSLMLLTLYFASHHAASQTTERSSFGEPTNETISLPGNFLMVLSLKGGVNQFGANILFNKVTFEKLYACLCHKDTYSCSGNVTYNYGSSYNYNTQNIETAQSSAAVSMSTKYSCEVPNFGFLANNAGGYFSCVRADGADSSCTTDYWSIHIGQCDLGSARVVWDAKYQASWNYTFSRNTPNKTIVSSCVCGAHGESSCDSRKAVMSSSNGTTAPSDTVTTHVFTSTTNSTTPYLKEAHSDSAAVIGGTVGALLVAAVVLLVVIIWRYRVCRKKNSADKDINKLTAHEQFRKGNHGLPPQIPTGGRNSKPSSLFVIPERGQKPDNDFPRWNHSGRKEDDEAASSIYCVIGSGVYEHDISMNDSTSNNNNNKNNSDEKVNKRIIDNIANNKNPFSSSSSINTDNKPFSLTVTNNDYIPGYSKFGNNNSLIHNSQNNLLRPKQDIKQRQRQPIPIEELIPASQDSNDRDGSAYSLGRHFQQNYNFLNMPVETRRIANANNSSGAPTGADNKRQVNSLNSQIVYPLNIEDHASDGSRYFSLDHDLFQYNDPSESGGSRTIQASFQDSFVNPRGGQ